MIQWQREWSIQVGSLKVDKLRVSFSISKSLKADPNTAQISVFNLAESTRAQMQEKGAPVILRAGYTGRAGVIFSGDARLVSHMIVRPDVETRITGGDGERAYLSGRSAFNFKPGTPVSKVLSSVINDLPCATRDAAAAIASGRFGLAFTAVQKGFATQGATVRELDRLLRPHGIEWSIQDGELQLLQGTQVTNSQAFRLSPDTGLVGSPERGTSETPGTQAALKVKCLLNPALKPGMKVDLRSRLYSGFYRVSKLTHQGDSHGANWLTSLEITDI